MRQSLIPHFIRKEAPKDEEAINAQRLIRGGYIDKVSAGVYTFLPLGWRVRSKIEAIIREEMNAIGAYELCMPVLHPKDAWMKTGRWNTLDVLFKVHARDKKEYALGPTHEEIISPLAQRAIFSYKDMPFGLYQIQTKFRDEPRAKSGLLRGKEFVMKDLYSFHTDAKDLDAYYERVIRAYKKIYIRMGIEAILTEASGGTFSKFSHEFQVFLKGGEDDVVYCKKCGFAQNKEINNAKTGQPCPSCGSCVSVERASEVGNIFRLGTKYSEACGLSYVNKKGTHVPVTMGCYGIGVSRLMGVLAELYNDERGLVWPASVAPFDVHLIALSSTQEKETKRIFKKAEAVWKKLQKIGLSVLYDDRVCSAGEKFAESDLIGIPIRLVISQKTGSKIEFKKRSENKAKLVDSAYIEHYFKKSKR